MKLLYFIIACLATLLGVIGTFLPVLPPTPFLLLAACCFAKSSTRFHRWFTHTKLYKKHLESFIGERSMTLRTKVTLLAFASTMLLLAMYFMDNLWLRLFLGFLILFKYYYFIFRIRTIPAE